MERKPREMWGFNPNAKEGFESGLAEGLLVVFDPLGIVIQFISQLLGYNIKTAGGIAFFGQVGYKMVRHNFGRALMKIILIIAGLGCWFRADSWPFAIRVLTIGPLHVSVIVLIAQLAFLLVNIIANVRCLIVVGTLRK